MIGAQMAYVNPMIVNDQVQMLFVRFTKEFDESKHPRDHGKFTSGGSVSESDLKTSYDRHKGDHIGGFVPIHKLYNDVGGSKEDFKAKIKDLAENYKVQLHSVDPADHTDKEKETWPEINGKPKGRITWQ
jgi:hypothetical protein